MADIKALARVARTKDIIEAEQESIIINAIKLRETKLQSIMIPREWIIYLRTNIPFEVNFEIAKNNFHTRYPVSNTDSVDGVIGYVNFKEMVALASNSRDLTIEQFIRPILYVGTDTNLNTMLKLFIANRQHLAMVKDQEGKIVGMVTLEDVLEEIVGDIEDEFDHSSSEVIQIMPNVWEVGGSVPMQTLLKRFHLPIEEDITSQTVSQWFRSKFGDRVYPGLYHQTGKAKFIAQQVRKGRVYRVIVELASEEKQTDHTQ